MHQGPFSGISVLDQGDSITDAGAAFGGQDRNIIDRLLEVGAVTHRHDAHNPLPDPTASPSAWVTASGGAIPGGRTIYVGFTLLDSSGGETILSEVDIETTGDQYDAPTDAPQASADYSAGSLLAGTYHYALTFTDGIGGETPIGPPVLVTRDPGYASGQVHLWGMADMLTAADAAGWRLYRATGGGQYDFLAEGSSDTFTDTGLIPLNCAVHPPTPFANTTVGANLLTVVIPSGSAGVSSAASQFRLYLSEDGLFQDPCLYGTYPPSSAGLPIEVPSLLLLQGAPPLVSTALRGANRIDPDTELIDWHWKRPVPTAADLPPAASGSVAGDVRVVITDGKPREFDGSAWSEWAMGGGSTTVPIDETGGTSANVPIWTKDGVPVLWLRGHQNEEEVGVMNETFDGASGTIGSGYARDGAGGAIPESGSANTNAIWYGGFTPTWATLYDGYVERTVTIDSNAWTRTGVTLGDLRVGLFAWIERVSGNLVIATRTVDSNLESDFTVLATDALPAAPAIADTYTIRLDRTKNHLHATVFQSKSVVAEVEADIPVPLQADFGDGVALRAGLSDRWTAVGAWTTASLVAVLHKHKRVLYAESVDYSGSLTRVVLIDGVGDRYSNFASQAEGVYSAGWADDTTWPASYLREGHGNGNTKLSGRSVKSSGSAPVLGDVIATLDTEARPYSDQLVPVVTGDDDGEQLGMVRVETGGNVVWIDGKSTTPSLKHPYVCFDGVPAYPTV